ncbi:MAG: O-antigen ligase family protein [Pseudolabrys sp.]
MNAIIGSKSYERWFRIADGLAVALAVVMPWSTSATAILAVLWLFTILPLLSLSDLRCELTTAAGGLPVLLALLGAAGMLWADVSWPEKFHGVDAFAKLLLLPLLLAYFRQSGGGTAVFGGYLTSCAILMAASWVHWLWPGLLPHAHVGAVTRNLETQSGEFVTCVFPLLWIVADMIERRRYTVAAGAGLLALGFLADIFFVGTARTSLVVIPVLLVLFGVRRLSLRGSLLLLAAGAVLAAAVWASSPVLRERVLRISTELHSYELTNKRTSSGERLEFWKKSIAFVRAAPLIGHGTGTIPKLFREAAHGSGVTAVASTNPHNQTFVIAIQLGLVGVVVLWAMWIAHVLLFRGEGLAPWIGLVVVVQNIVGSLFNSHLSDFVQGWVYVVGVGVAGAMMRRIPNSPASER